MFGLYSLKHLKKKHKISFRYAKHLILNKELEAIIRNDRVFVTEESLKKFLSKTKKERKAHHKSFLEKIGPGIITGAADDDPSGVVTYSTVGSRFGLGLSWMAIYLLPLMTAVQETCARIGIVTNKGLAGVLKEKFNNKIVFVLVLLLLVANTINIGADIGAMAASLRMISGVDILIGAIFFSAVIILLEVFVKYHQYAKILKWLLLSLFAYVVTAIIIKPNIVEVLSSLAIPKIEFGLEYVMAIVAVLGTTISPYLFFWQSSQEVEEEKENHLFGEHKAAIVREEIHEMRKDTISGMSIANLVFLFIVITTAFVLFKNGIMDIETAEDAASALKPLAGEFASFLFTLGIIGTGLLAIPVLAGASAYAISELFKWKEGLSLSIKKAHGFYGVIILSTFVGLLMNVIGINPIKALYYAAIINGLVASVLLVFIFSIGNDKKIMGSHTNPLWVKVFGTITVIFMGLSSLTLIATFILGVK